MENKMDYYRAKTYRFIVRFVKNENLAEDLTQDVMMKAWGYRHRISELSDPDNYILKMAKHHVFDHFEKLSREKEYQEEVWMHIRQNSERIDSSLIENDINRRLDAVIKTLPPRQQEILHMNVRKGLSLDEIATSLDIAPRTARNHLNRARKVVRSHMDPGSFLGWLILIMVLTFI